MVVVGVDEVGRGAWAGPLVAAAVILTKPISGLTDSKLLSKAGREKFARSIKSRALAIGTGWVWPNQIDDNGLTKAVRSAMQAALRSIQVPFDHIIIDGNYNFLKTKNTNDEQKGQTCLCCLWENDAIIETIVAADGSVPAVSAASIIAKVARDAFMAEVARKYPQYGFEKHVGYGTPQHRQALQRYGACNLHRQSYSPVAALLH